MYRRLVVCCDRGGIVTRDENGFLRREDNWKDRLEFLPGVLEGVRLLNGQGIMPFMIMDQPDAALDFFGEARGNEVNRYILDLASGAGSYFGGHAVFNYVAESDAGRAAANGKNAVSNYIRSGHADIKPRIGMLEQAVALQFRGRKLEDCQVYVIGDRLKDVELGLNGGGAGILIESSKTCELGDVEQVRELQTRFRGRVHILPDYLTAAQIILSLTEPAN